MLFGQKNSSIRSLARACRSFEVERIPEYILSKQIYYKGRFLQLDSSAVTGELANSSASGTRQPSFRLLNSSATQNSSKGQQVEPDVPQEVSSSSASAQCSTRPVAESPAPPQAAPTPLTSTPTLPRKARASKPPATAGPTIITPEPGWTARLARGSKQRGTAGQEGEAPPAARASLWKGMGESGWTKRLPPSPLPRHRAGKLQPLKAIKQQQGQEARAAGRARATQPLLFKGQAAQQQAGSPAFEKEAGGLAFAREPERLSGGRGAEPAHECGEMAHNGDVAQQGAGEAAGTTSMSHRGDWSEKGGEGEGWASNGLHEGTSGGSFTNVAPLTRAEGMPPQDTVCNEAGSLGVHLPEAEKQSSSAKGLGPQLAKVFLARGAAGVGEGLEAFGSERHGIGGGVRKAGPSAMAPGQKEAKMKLRDAALEQARLRKLQKLNMRIVRKFDALEEALKSGQLTPDERLEAAQDSIAHMAQALRQPLDSVNLATFMFRLSKAVTLKPLHSVRHRVQYMDVMRQLVERFERHVDRQLHRDSWLADPQDAVLGKSADAVDKQTGWVAMELRTLSSAMWACGNVRYPLKPDQLDKMAGLAMTQLQQLSVDSLSMILKCLFAYSRTHRPFEGRVMQVIAERAGHFHPLDFPPRTLLSVLCHLTELDVQLSKPTLTCLSLSALSQISDFDPPQLGTLLSSLAKLSLDGRVESLPMGEKLFRAAAVQSLTQLDRFQPATLSNLLYGFGVTKFDPGQEMLDAVAAYAEQNLEQYNGRGLANMVWALARLGYSPDVYADTGMPIYYVLNPRHPVHYGYSEEGYQWETTPGAALQSQPQGPRAGDKGAAAAKEAAKEEAEEGPKRTLLRVVTVPHSKTQLREMQQREEEASKKREGLSDLGQRVAEALDRRQSMQTLLRAVSREVLAVRDRVAAVDAPTPTAHRSPTGKAPRGRSRPKAARPALAPATPSAAEPAKPRPRVDERNILALAGAILRGPHSGHRLDSSWKFPFTDPAGHFAISVDPLSGWKTLRVAYDPAAVLAMMPSRRQGTLTWDYDKFPEVPLRPRVPMVEQPGPDPEPTLSLSDDDLPGAQPPQTAAETEEQLMAVMLRGVAIPQRQLDASTLPPQASSGPSQEHVMEHDAPLVSMEALEDGAKHRASGSTVLGRPPPDPAHLVAGMLDVEELVNEPEGWPAQRREGQGGGQGGLEEGLADEDELGGEVSLAEEAQLDQLLETGTGVGLDAVPNAEANPGKKLLAEDAEEEEEAEEGGAGGPAAGEATALSRTAALTELPPSPAVRPQPDDDSLVDSIVGTSQGLAAMSPAKLKKYVLRQQNLFEMPQTAVERWSSLPRATLDQLAQACAHRMAQFSPLELSSVLWAYATQRHMHPPLFRAALARLEQEGGLQNYPLQALSIIAWSCAVLREKPSPDLLDRMLGQMLKGGQKAPQVQPTCNMAWALAVFGYLDRAKFERLVQMLPLVDQASQKIPHPALCQLFQCALHLEGEEGDPHASYLPPPLLQQAQQAWRSRQTTTSLYQEDVQAVLMHMGVPFRSEYSTGDKLYAIDIAVKGKGGSNLAIEVDGPFHFTTNPPFKPLASTDMRNRLLAKHGWLVVTVPCDHWKSLITLQAKVEYLQTHVLSQIELSDEFLE